VNVTAVHMMGAVSPLALATPIITPVRMPGMAEGRTTFLMVCHLVAPRAMLPSRKELGTLFKASWQVRMMVGILISPRMMEPDKRDTPKNRTRKARPKRPKTTDGTPLRQLTAMVISLLNFWLREYS